MFLWRTKNEEQALQAWTSADFVHAVIVVTACGTAVATIVCVNCIIVLDHTASKIPGTTVHTVRLSSHSGLTFTNRLSTVNEYEYAYLY